MTKHIIDATIVADSKATPDRDFSAPSFGQTFVGVTQGSKDWKAFEKAKDNLEAALELAPSINVSAKSAVFRKVLGTEQYLDADLAIENDYQSKGEATIRFKLDNETLSIPVTHDNLLKLQNAYEEGAKAAKAITTKLNTDHKPVTEDEIFNGVSVAMKRSLQASKLL